MIKSIHLVNWRSHHDSKFEFRKGTNLLVGIMGAGKSSVLEGISFALFGTFPALERRKLKLDDIVRLNERVARVALEFEWEGRPYRVVRAIERGKRGTNSSAQLFRDGLLAEEGPVAVTAYVQTLLSMDYGLFTRAIYSEQNNIDYFLTLDPRRRKEEVDALLGLDKFELARANAVSVINQVRGRREAISSKFNLQRLAELDGEEKAHSSEAASAGTKLAEVSAACDAKGKELASLVASFEGMRLKRERFDHLQKESIRILAQQEALQKELEGSETDESAYEKEKTELSRLITERARQMNALKAWEAKNASLSKEAGATEAKIRSAAEAKAKLEAAQAELKSLLAADASQERLQTAQKECENALLALESERRSDEQAVAEASELMKKLKPGLSECPLCSSKLDDSGITHIKSEKDALVSAKKKRLAALAETIQKKTHENSTLVLRLKKASLLADRAAQLEGELKGAEGLSERKKRAEGELAALATERKGLQKRADEASSAVEKLHVSLSRMETVLAKRKTLLSLGKALAEAREGLATTEFNEKSFDAHRESVERLRIDAERLFAERKAASALLETSKKMLAMVQIELSALRAMEVGIAELYRLEEQLSIYKNALLETQTGLRASLSEAINTAMNELWPIFYPYRNYRALRLAVSEKDYVFEVDDGSEWKPLETIASGGERACAALTLRVALAMVLTPKLSWLILDEPTHNLDREAVGLLSEALQVKVPEVVKQTFVITHDEAFMGSEFASSYRLMRDKETNGDTKVEAI